MKCIGSKKDLGKYLPPVCRTCRQSGAFHIHDAAAFRPPRFYLFFRFTEKSVRRPGHTAFTGHMIFPKHSFYDIRRRFIKCHKPCRRKIMVRRTLITKRLTYDKENIFRQLFQRAAASQSYHLFHTIRIEPFQKQDCRRSSRRCLKDAEFFLIRFNHPQGKIFCQRNKCPGFFTAPGKNKPFNPFLSKKSKNRSLRQVQIHFFKIRGNDSR